VTKLKGLTPVIPMLTVWHYPELVWVGLILLDHSLTCFFPRSFPTRNVCLVLLSPIATVCPHHYNGARLHHHDNATWAALCQSSPLLFRKSGLPFYVKLQTSFIHNLHILTKFCIKTFWYFKAQKWLSFLLLFLSLFTDSKRAFRQNCGIVLGGHAGCLAKHFSYLSFSQ
jgi:hypothetical protein